MLTTYIDKNVSQLLTSARYKLERALNEHKRSGVLFLTSGGSCFRILEGFNANNLGPDITIGVLDERADTDPSANNFQSLKQTEFFQKAYEQGAKFIDTTFLEGETPENLAKEFVRNLRTWQEENPHGIIIATMGMGPDGHTAGIFPYPEDKIAFTKLFSTEDFTLAYDVAGRNEFTQRVTTTPAFLKLIDYAVFFATGEAKAEAFKRTMAEEGEFHITPARIIHEMKDIDVFSDIEV